MRIAGLKNPANPETAGSKTSNLSPLFSLDEYALGLLQLIERSPCASGSN